MKTFLDIFVAGGLILLPALIGWVHIGLWIADGLY